MKDGNNGDKTKEQLVIELEEVDGVLKLKREHYTNRAANPDPDATALSPDTSTGERDQDI